MKLMLHVKFPHEEFNAAVRDGTAGEKLNRILEETKPDAVYFTEQNGHRAAILVVDVKDASQIATFAEPWFLGFRADVEIRTMLSREDLERAGLDALGKKWS